MQPDRGTEQLSNGRWHRHAVRHLSLHRQESLVSVCNDV